MNEKYIKKFEEEYQELINRMKTIFDRDRKLKGYLLDQKKIMEAECSDHHGLLVINYALNHFLKDVKD